MGAIRTTAGRFRCAAVVLATATLLCADRATAEPRTFHCKTSGATRSGFGNLVLTVDVERRAVRVAMPKWPGFVSEYQDGRFGQIYIQVPEGRAAFSESVAQFVNVRRNAIEVGYRSAEGALLHLAQFNRAALSGAPCHWKAWDEFELVATQPKDVRRLGTLPPRSTRG